MRWPLVVALVAVTAFAASATTVGAQHLITGADIEDGSITGHDIELGSLSAEHLEAKARHTVYASSVPANAFIDIGSGRIAHVASVVVPPGDYVIQAQVTVEWRGASTRVNCGITDDAHHLTGLHARANPPTSNAFLSMTPLATVATVSYAHSVTVYLTCQPVSAPVAAYFPGIVAEQVSLAQ